MNCLNCGHEFSLKNALGNALFSWPEMSVFWTVCEKCQSGNHVMVNDEQYAQVQVFGPGSHWEQLNTYTEKGLSKRVDPSILHIWLGNKHYEIQARR